MITQDKAKALAKNSRVSVSAEVFGRYHKKEAFTPTVIKKPEQTKLKYIH
jgi:hypothetical protein